MGDHLKFKGSLVRDNYGNFSNENGIACADYGSIIKKSIIVESNRKHGVASDEPVLLDSARILADNRTPGKPETPLPPLVRDVDLGDLPSPLKTICDNWEQIRGR